MTIDEHGTTVRLVECDNDGEPTPERESCDVRVRRDGDSAIRIIMDPFGEDHDVLIECHDDKWMVFIHPGGNDPFCIAALTHRKAVVMDDFGNVLKQASW